LNEALLGARRIGHRKKKGLSRGRLTPSLAIADNEPSRRCGMMAADRRVVLGMMAAGLTAPSGAVWAQGAPRRIVGALEEDPPFINPPLTSIISSFGSGCPVYSALTWVNRTGEIFPDLAERWEISPDGKTYTFHLRKNVEWHDGAPFTSADVKFSLENVTAKLHPWGKGAFRSLENVDASDPHVAVLRLKIPSAALMNATNNAISAILPKHLWEGTEFLRNPHNKKPIGTGPFKLVEYVSGDRIRYVKNEKFYIPGQPGFDELVLRIMPDAAARVAAFEKGEIDMLYNNAVPFTEIARLQKLPNVDITQAQVAASAFLGIINTRSKPYDDVRVRQALAHAIDRAFIRENVMPGFSNNQIGPLPPSMPLANKKLKDYAFDPARANQLLDEGGYARKADGTRFEFRLLWAANDIRITKMADIIRQNLTAVGITTSLQPLEREVIIRKGFISEQFDMIIGSYAQGPDPDIGTERLYNSNNILTPPAGFTNNSAYANPEVDRLFDEQRVQTDPARRKDIYDRIQEIIWEAVPVLPILAYSSVSVFRSNVMQNAFDSPDGSKESFARVIPAKAVAGSDSSAGAQGSRTGLWAGAAGVAAAFGAFWLWRRRARAETEDEAEEKA
jgi:peptide/nickel transport system substrate-binding protein